jgi:hypothetical protein
MGGRAILARPSGNTTLQITKARLRRLPASHEAPAGVEAGKHVPADFWRKLGKKPRQPQKLAVVEVALDLVAAQVADEAVADGKSPSRLIGL